MQCAVIEFSRNVLGHGDANSTEFDKKSSFPVIDIMEQQKKIAGLGGTMRLGAYPCRIEVDTKAREVYQTELILERHRHRYEFNNKFMEECQSAGMTFSGINPRRI